MTSSHIQNYFRPESLDEALKILAKGDGRYVPLAGGVSVKLAGASKIEGVVDISGLSLNYIQDTGETIKIGAATLLTDVERAEAIAANWSGLLSKAAESVATAPLRNLITIGGDIVQCYYWSCIPPAILALDATVKIASLEGIRECNVSEFFKSHPRTTISPEEILTEVEIPKINGVISGDFINFKRVDSEYAAVNLAVLLVKNGDIIESARISLGSVSILPIRLTPIEKILAGKVIDEELMETAVDEVGKLVNPMRDIRFTQDYRRHLCQVLLKRVLQES